MLFKERLRIHKEFVEWAKKYSIEHSAFNIISYLDIKGKINSWIPVNDGLPDENCYVLVTLHRYSSILYDWIIDGVTCTEFNKATGKFQIEKDYTNHEVKVKAWMILPRPYIEECKREDAVLCLNHMIKNEEE